MAIEIVSFPIKNGDLNHSYVKLPEGIPSWCVFFLYEPSEKKVIQHYLGINKRWLWIFWMG